MVVHVVPDLVKAPCIQSGNHHTLSTVHDIRFLYFAVILFATELSVDMAIYNAAPHKTFED